MEMNGELLADLHERELIQFGQFVLKSGQISSIYVDLRLLITYRDIRNKAIDQLCEAIKNAGIEFDYVVGVPYGALLLADKVAESLSKDTIIKRKEAKSYGKKEMFLGHFEPGKRVVIIEDVVTSGLSVMETVNELNKVGLICKDAFCIVDREQGGAEYLEKEGIKLHSLIRINSILDFLVKVNEITQVKRAEIVDQLKNPQYENASTKITKEDWAIQKRFAAFEEGTLNRKLADIILGKKTNLCLAVDGCSKEKIIKISENIGDSICALKLHCDTIDKWDQEFADKLRSIANSKNFLLFEDRKLADTANTMELQLTGGHYRIAEWADLVTIYPEPGKKSIEALKSIVDSPKYPLSAFLMLAELSTEGAKTNIQNGVEVAEAIGSEMIGGFICQKRCSDNPKFLYWTPGVNLRKSTDGKGQRWRGPEQAILEDGCDIIIVGRGVTDAADDDKMVEEARKYANSAWEALTKC